MTILDHWHKGGEILWLNIVNGTVVMYGIGVVTVVTIQEVDIQVVQQSPHMGTESFVTSV